MHSLKASIAVLVLGMLVYSRIAIGQLPSPDLQSLGQLGGQVGQAVTPLGNAKGQNLVDATLFSPLISGTALKIPEDASPGVVQLRAKTKLGLSNSRNFLITKLPWTTATGNETSASPFSIVAGTYYQDECPERGRNFYRIRVDHEQTIQIVSFASCLDSRAKLSLTLQNPGTTLNTKTVAASNATNDRDAVLTAKLTANTDYTLTISDQLFRGGAEYRYAFILTVIQDSGSTSSTTDPATRTWQLLSGQLDSLHGSPSLAPSLETRFMHPRSAMIRGPLATGEPVVHSESSCPDSMAMSVEWPIRISGAFESNDDVDMFDFGCEQDTNVAIETLSQRLGEATDTIVSIHRVDNPGQPTEKLQRIADNDDFPAIGNGEMRFSIKDSIVNFRAPAKGIYRLIVRDQQRSNRTLRSPAYAVEIRKPKPGYVLSANWTAPIREIDQATWTSSTISTGGAMMLTVHALRFDSFTGPIELKLSGLPVDFPGISAVIASDQNFVNFSLSHNTLQSSSSAAEAISKVQVAGRAVLADVEIVSIATPLEVIWNLIDTYRSPIARMATELLFVRPESRICPLSIELGPLPSTPTESVMLTAIRGQPLKIPVRVTRRTGGEASVITIRLRQTPTKATAAEVKIDAKANEGTLDLQIPKDAPIGDYMLGALCEAAVSVPNIDPAAKEPNSNLTLQLPSSSIRIRIGDAP
jgi:hypothetical protein